MLSNKYVLGLIGLLIILGGSSLLLLAGTTINALSTIGVILFLIIMIVGMMICASGEFYAGSAVILALMLYIIRLTVSRLNRPAPGEIATPYYTFLASDWLNLIVVGFMVLSGGWLVISLLYRESYRPTITIKPVEANNIGDGQENGANSSNETDNSTKNLA